MSPAWKIASKEATSFETGHDPGLGGRSSGMQFVCRRPVRTPLPAQRHPVIKLIVGLNERGRPTPQLRAFSGLRSSSALCSCCPSLKGTQIRIAPFSWAARGRMCVRQGCERYSMSPSQTGYALWPDLGSQLHCRATTQKRWWHTLHDRWSSQIYCSLGVCAKMLRSS